jgi:hypothetical protein
MRLRLVLVPAFLILLALPASAALQYPCADNSTGCGGFSIDQQPGGDGTGGGSDWYGSPFYYCGANSKWGQLCWDAAQDPVSKKWSCVQVKGWGHCGCNKATSATLGVCEQKYTPQ